MLRRIEDFQKDWPTRPKMTGKVLNTLTDESRAEGDAGRTRVRLSRLASDADAW
jgi:hypothetical protein